MTLALEIPRLPLQTDRDGVVRVGGTRVTLDTIVKAFLGGASAEEIADQYSAVSLPDVYAVISFYLARKEDVDAYLCEREAFAQDVRRENEAGSERAGLRAKLLHRRANRGTTP